MTALEAYISVSMTMSQIALHTQGRYTFNNGTFKVKSYYA